MPSDGISSKWTIIFSLFFAKFLLVSQFNFFWNDTDDKTIQGNNYINYIIKISVSISLSSKNSKNIVSNLDQEYQINIIFLQHSYDGRCFILDVITKITILIKISKIY